MADFTITISNSINCFGPAPSDKWNAFAWNAFKWGEGTAEIIQQVDKVIAETLTPADSVTKSPNKTVTESIATASETESEYLTDTEGYYKVFPGQVTNADDRVVTSWSQSAASSTSWASGAGTSTSWTTV